jgi:hypothetical protein
LSATRISTLPRVPRLAAIVCRHRPAGPHHSGPAQSPRACSCGAFDGRERSKR